MARDEALVALGVITGAHGVRGELRVKAYNPGSDLLGSLEAVSLRPKGGGPAREVALHGARRHGAGWLVRIEGCGDRDAAEALRGSELCVPRAALPALEPGEYYLVDLVGLEARLPDGAVLGRVSDALEYPASCVLRVETERGAIEVPLHDRYVVEVRLDEGLVIVDHVDELELVPAGRRRS